MNAAQTVCSAQGAQPSRLAAPRPAGAEAPKFAGRKSSLRNARIVLTGVPGSVTANSAAPAQSEKPVFTAWDTAKPRVAKRTDIKSVLVLGAGPIVIGQVRLGWLGGRVLGGPGSCGGRRGPWVSGLRPAWVPERARFRLGGPGECALLLGLGCFVHAEDIMNDQGLRMSCYECDTHQVLSITVLTPPSLSPSFPIPRRASLTTLARRPARRSRRRVTASSCSTPTLRRS